MFLEAIFFPFIILLDRERGRETKRRGDICDIALLFKKLP